MEKFFYENSQEENLLKKFRNKEYREIKDLKNDSRSKVTLIDIDGEQYVYKIPLEKNKRIWQRILSIFRGGESKREFENYKKVLKAGFNGPTPLIYGERKRYGMVVDSFLISTYVQGKKSTVEDLDKILETLKKIHAQGFLHGDSQLANFTLSEGKVYLIDTKMNKNIYGAIGEAYEYIYLEESCYQELTQVDKSTLSYRVAKSLNSYLHWYGGVRKKIKNFFK